jgi:hypothetical protein
MFVIKGEHFLTYHSVWMGVEAEKIVSAKTPRVRAGLALHARRAR